MRTCRKVTCIARLGTVGDSGFILGTFFRYQFLLMFIQPLVLQHTDHAQMALGDLVYVELPDGDSEVASGDAFAVVESVKAASDVYLPLSGTIVEINEALDEGPELVNSDPYGEGWLVRFRPDTPSELDELLSGDDYQRFVAELED